ncbi:L-alanine-DL-glutamate epimerase-like enolase superfamily enzyme [Saonia flava]|uniref:Dipeptide epimerase n=1 Tax=Saonia flava TaxID=523696 RepID=A0A846QZ29_9FLAO|nr:dipeptide epimerase [Saonia flava]NJB71902.1 L-alanine-DL-glutamate epimerase-like enolase superfamily enzyme [Saonia flava]
MKITHISYERLDLKLSSPYTIAYETISKTTNFILKIETEGKLVGYGCAAPDKIVTGETPDELEIAINTIITDYLKGKDASFYAHILWELKELLGKKSSALAMVDIALHDLFAKKAKVQLYKFLGGYRSSIATSITVGILPLKETLELAQNYVSKGFSILKIKGGSHLGEDIEKMIKLREKHPNITFRFDGNQGYSVVDSIAFVKATSSVGIEIFEQPTKLEVEERLGKVTEQVSIPVMADESLKTLGDAFRLAQNERVDMVNIKLMKVGGIMAGMHINSVAKSANIDAMVGCIDECGLGIAAGLHFALSRPNILYADLDGHLDIIDDPYHKMFKLENGIMYPNDTFGLGMFV